MSFLIRNKTAGAIDVDDLGIQVAAAADFDLLQLAPQDVQSSGLPGGDLNTSIIAGDVVVLDPKDGTTELSVANSIIVTQIHNNPPWGVTGAYINELEDVDTTGAVTGDILQLDGSGNYVSITPATLAGSMNFDDLGDVIDGAGHDSGKFYILQGDGTNLVSVDGATDTTLFIPFLEDTTGSVVSGGVQTDITLTYNAGTNKIDASIDDNFLRNTGDTLDSGSLTIASGASIVIQSGAIITIIDAPINGTDAANKIYVDNIAQGADAKESVHYGTTPGGGNLGGTYNASGGTGGTGAITGIPTTTIDGFVVAVSDRIIVKDQTDIKQNGIYVITAIYASPVSMDMERAPDHDGSPSSEVSAGNFAFIELGAINGNTSWIIIGDGILTLNTDDIVWTQFSGAGSFTAGAGLGLNGTDFFLDVNNLISVAITGSDEIAFNDVSDTDLTKKRTFDNVIADLGLYTSGNLTASDGVLITGSDIQMDITNLTATAPALSSEIVFDFSGSGTHNKTTIASLFDNLNVPYGITTNGILVRTADDTYVSRIIIADTTADQIGILVTNGDGVAGNPEIGLDITGTTVSGASMTSTDEFIGFNGVDNLAFTGQQIADGVSIILGGLGNAYTIIQGETGSTVAASSTDTLAFLNATNGGIVTVASDGAPDSVTFAFDLPDLAVGVGTIDFTDELAVGEGVNTVKYTFNDVVDDLGIVSGVSTLTGILVSDGAGNYSSTTIVADGVGNTDGLVVTNGNGVAGNPSVGLDINGNVAAAENLAATDEVIVYNASTSANEKMTGQEVADGVSVLLGFGGLSVTTINGQEILTLVDTTRSDKILSVGDTSVTWSENKIGNNDWIEIGNSVDALSGYVVPLNATIVKITAHTSDNKGITKPIQLYIDGVLDGTIGTFAGGAGEDTFRNVTLNIDVTQDQKLRLRGGTGGTIEDTVITLWLKWRG